MDMFDCVIPTRLARHGLALTSLGKVHIRNAKYRDDFSALDPACHCDTCRHYSKAYLRHLGSAKEILGLMLMSAHNVFYLVNHVKRLRQEILDS